MSTFCTTAKWGPPYGSSSTGSCPSGSAPPGVKSAIRRSRAPPTKNVGVAKSTGVSEVEAIVPTRSPSTSTSVVGRPVIVAEVSTVTFEPTTAVWTPGSSVRRVSVPAASTRHTCVSVGSSFARKTHRVTDIEDLRHLQADRGHRLVVERQALGVVAIEGADQAAVGEPRGDPDGDVEPPVVVVLADEVGLPRVRIDPQDLHRALIARLHQQGQRALRVPHDVHEVGEGLAIPRDVDASAVEVDDRERDDGVIGARARVANRTRRRLRIDRRGDVPDTHGTFVDASGRQSRPVGGPPVAALTLHLFGGDELREPPGHVGVGIGRDLSIVRAVHVHDAEGASCDVRDVPSGWVGPRIERVLDVDVQRTRASVHEVGDVETAVHRERRDRARAVGGVVGDPGQ